MTILESFLLGLIQGLTEFLPVSSSGHIELGKILLGIQVQDPLLFSIVVHAATALSTMVIYWRDIWQILRDLLRFTWNPSTRFALMILLSMIPVGLVGVFFEEQVNTLFEGRLMLVGFMLLLTAGLLYLSSRIGEEGTGTAGEVTFGKALVVGVAQAIAIMPGISRSGATISTALMLGISREQAARFSFLMVLPPILGATLLKVKDYLEMSSAPDPAAAGLASVGPVALVVGFVAAFGAGLLACKWMIAIVKRSKLDWFALYCLVVGLIAVIGSLI